MLALWIVVAFWISELHQVASICAQTADSNLAIGFHKPYQGSTTAHIGLAGCRVLHTLEIAPVPQFVQDIHGIHVHVIRIVLCDRTLSCLVWGVPYAVVPSYDFLTKPTISQNSMVRPRIEGSCRNLHGRILENSPIRILQLISLRDSRLGEPAGSMADPTLDGYTPQQCLCL